MNDEYSLAQNIELPTGTFDEDTWYEVKFKVRAVGYGTNWELVDTRNIANVPAMYVAAYMGETTMPHIHALQGKRVGFQCEDVSISPIIHVSDEDITQFLGDITE